VWVERIHEPGRAWQRHVSVRICTFVLVKQVNSGFTRIDARAFNAEASGKGGARPR
jgi:hypothetical protein